MQRLPTVLSIPAIVIAVPADAKVS